MIPLPIGFLFFMDSSIIPLTAALEIKSKCGVSPLITQPKARKASYLSIILEIVTGISKMPGTRIGSAATSNIFLTLYF